jgi:hypothetical protein
MGRDVVPADGAVGVPTDATVRVFLRAFPATVRAAIAAEYRLRDVSGALVPFDARVVGTRLDLDPRAALQPDTEYRLEQLFAYDRAGVRLADTDRWRAGGSGLRGAWFPVVGFRSGAGPSSAAHRVPTIAGAALHFAHGGGDCGPATAVSVDLSGAAGGATDILELRVRGQGLVATDRADGTPRLYAGDMLCDPDPVTLRAGASLEVQVALLDASGRELGATPWRRAAGRGPRPPSSGRAPLAYRGGWSALSLVQPRAAAGAGPAGCAFGLEVVSRRELVREGAPWMHGDRSTLVTEGASGWIAFAGAERAPALRIFSLAGTPMPATLPGIPQAMLPGPTGPLLVSRVYAAGGASQSALSALDARGRRTWSTPIAGEAGRYRLARGGGRVLVAWGAFAADYSELLAWAVFDERTGAPIVPATPTAHGIDTNAEGPAAAFVDGRFMIVWPNGAGLLRRGPLRAAVVNGAVLGPAIDIPVASDGPPDLTAAGTHAGLATAAAGGRIAWTLLDRDGHVAAGPVVVSAGVGGTDNRLPRIATDGRLFAVAWESYPDPGAYVAVVDAAGVASPALRIDQLEPLAGSVGIAATPAGFAASYTVDRGRGILASLRCRTQPGSGAPQLIDP